MQLKTMVADYRRLRHALWSRFNPGAGDQLWYYRALVEIIRGAQPSGRLLEQLEGYVLELESLTDPG